VVPFPKDGSVGVVGRYQTALKAMNLDAAPGFASLEGYMVGRLAVAALNKIDGELTRKTLLEAVAKTGPPPCGGSGTSRARSGRNIAA
jgi:branched-chain amino acid transport system substrate-binding protein